MSRLHMMYVGLMHLRARLEPLVAVYGLVAAVPGVHTKPYAADDVQELTVLYEQMRRCRITRRQHGGLYQLFQEVEQLYDNLIVQENQAYREE